MIHYALGWRRCRYNSLSHKKKQCCHKTARSVNIRIQIDLYHREYYLNVCACIDFYISIEYEGRDVRPTDAGYLIIIFGRIEYILPDTPNQTKPSRLIKSQLTNGKEK